MFLARMEVPRCGARFTVLERASACSAQPWAEAHGGTLKRAPQSNQQLNCCVFLTKWHWATAANGLAMRQDGKHLNADLIRKCCTSIRKCCTLYFYQKAPTFR